MTFLSNAVLDLGLSPYSIAVIKNENIASNGSNEMEHSVTAFVHNEIASDSLKYCQQLFNLSFISYWSKDSQLVI